MVKGMTSCRPPRKSNESEIKSNESEMVLINRQAAIDTAEAMHDRCDTLSVDDYRDMMVEALTVLPSAQPDLSGYSDRLWKAAYERGKAEAQADIIHCGECKYYGDSDGCFFSTATTGADGFCHWAERKEGEADVYAGN